MKLDLADLKKRWQTRSALAITLESGRVAVALVRAEEGGARMVKMFSLPFGAESVAADPEKAGAALAEHLAGEGIRERRCVVCVPPGWALSTSAEAPEITGEDLRGYLELRAEREFPIAVSDLRLAHCAYRLPDGQQHATLAAVPAKRLEAVERMLTAAGCRAVSISLGLDSCLPPAGAPAAMHVLANGNHVDVVVTAGGGVATLRTLAGSPSNGAPFDVAGFSREVRITLGRLPETLRLQLHEARFSGSPASAETLRDRAREQFQRMGLEAALNPEDDVAGSALEAARSYLRQRPVLFEFVPPQTNRFEVLMQRFDSRGRRWIAAAALAFVILPVLAFVIRSHMESRLEAEWKGMARNVAELEKLQQNIRKFRPWFESAPVNVQALEALMTAFPEQGEVWAKSVQLGEDGKVSCAGFARSQAAMTGVLDKLRSREDVTGLQLQQVRGEKPVQFSIVYKWAPRHAN